ncbi:MAG: ParB/RepB/Spo0J family partition protein [Eubacteriales bacterium]|nr:ParB/RepB/Spo0J family partition protein [Eubacteriales bacterium]
MARRGLGKGLGAFFGEEVIQEVEKDHEDIRNRGSEDTDTAEKSRVRTAKTDDKPKKEEANTQDSEKSANKSEKSTKIAGTAVSDRQSNPKEEEPKEITIKLSRIEPNREQPRKEFNEEQMQELADSIRQYGVLQPLLVQKKDDYYEIIAGERRWRAAKMAGLQEVPVVIREYSKQQAVEIALIENVQREDLNPIEEALAYQRLMQEFQLKQEEIAERVSKNRTTITNSMRLLNLCPDVQKMLINGQISSGHARALLGVEDSDTQLQLALKIEKERLSVREVEKLVKQLAKGPRKKKEKQEDEALELIFKDLEERMKTVMGTKVNISRKDKSKGRIEIEYYSESELERIVELIESIH